MSGGGEAGEVSVLVVSEVAPSRSVKGGDGTSLILEDLLGSLPPNVRATVVSPTAPPPTPGVTFEELPRPSWTGWRTTLERARLGRAVAFVDPAALDRIRSLAAAHDVVYLHGPSTMPLAPLLAPSRPVVVNPIDLWSDHHRQAAATAPDLRGRIAGTLRARRFAREEAAAAASATSVIVVSESEAATWRSRHGGEVVGIPNGLVGERGGWTGSDGTTALFVGSLDYEPNIASVFELVDEVLPRLEATVPGVRLRIVGRRPVPEVLSRSGGAVDVLGDVPSVADHYRSAALALFPGSLGTGTRNCVLEAMVAGCPVIASGHSARGIPPGAHLIVADSDDAMAGAAATLLQDRARLEAAAAAAAAFGAGLPTPTDMAERYFDVILGAVSR